jgi:phytoene/squalene synthetase
MSTPDATPDRANQVSTGQVDVVRVAARAFEIDRYLASLLAPAAARDDLIALAAFAGEIARIPLFVTEPMMGRIRLQWWRETLENGIDGGNPIASAIISASNRHGFEVSELIRFIDAHESTLDDVPFADDQALQAHFAATEGVLLSCAAKVLGPGFDLWDMPHREVHVAAANAYGLARLVAELPVTLAAGHVLIPADRLSAVAGAAGRFVRRRTPLQSRLAGHSGRAATRPSTVAVSSCPGRAIFAGFGEGDRWGGAGAAVHAGVATAGRAMHRSAWRDVHPVKQQSC